MYDVRSIFNTRPAWVSVSTEIVKEISFSVKKKKSVIGEERRAKQRLGKEQWEERCDCEWRWKPRWLASKHGSVLYSDKLGIFTTPDIPIINTAMHFNATNKKYFTRAQRLKTPLSISIYILSVWETAKHVLWFESQRVRCRSKLRTSMLVGDI